MNNKYPIKKDCFAYAAVSGTQPEHCTALNTLECQKRGTCNFYCHHSKVDMYKTLQDIKNYTATHNADGSKKN